MYAGVIPTVMEDFGKDIVIGAGAGMHAHPSGIEAGIKSLRQAADAFMQGVSLEEYAKEHKELQEAIDLWGVYDAEKSIYELTN